jgi:hypothetical protein
MSWHSTPQGLVLGEFEYRKDNEALEPGVDLARDKRFWKALFGLLKEENLSKYFGIPSAFRSRGGSLPVEAT